MKIFTKRKTDDEYMKGVVSSYNKRWYLYSIGLAIAIIIISVTFYFINVFDNKISTAFEKMKFDEKNIEKQHNEFIDTLQYYSGVKLGFHFALGIYVSMGLFILSITAILNQRKDKLLIELYEKSKKDEKAS